MTEQLIPSNWQIKQLVDVCIHISDIDHQMPKKTIEGFPLISTKDFTPDGKINFENAKIISEEDYKRLIRKCNPQINDILFSRIGTIGKTVKVDTDRKFTISYSLVLIRPNQDVILPDYLLYYLRSNQIIIQSKQQTRSIGTPDLGLQKIRQFEIPLPPLLIQKKITEKTKYVILQIEEKKKQIIELQKSVQNSIHYLNNKVLGEKFAELMHLNSPIDGWNIKTMKEICVSIVPGFAQGKKNVVNGVIHLRMNNIARNFEINLDLTRRVAASNDQLRKYKLEYNDIVFNNTNSLELVGKSALFKGNEICLFSNHLTRLRVYQSQVIPEWILFYLRARWLNGDFMRMCNRWINQAAFNTEKIKKLEVPIPPYDTQEKIIKALENVSSIISIIKEKLDLIKSSNAIVAKYLVSLPQKVLDMAFTGKLIYDYDLKS